MCIRDRPYIDNTGGRKEEYGRNGTPAAPTGVFHHCRNPVGQGDGRALSLIHIWGLGNFGGVSLQQMPAFALVTIVGLFVSLVLIKPLNALLLGERYAENLGVNIRRVRNWLLIITGLLTAVTTACGGPVAFIGLAVPHVARMILGTANHNALLPVTILSGGAVALLCNLICVLPGEAGIIPLNAVTPIIGAPVIIYVILSQRKPQQFN